MKKLAIVFGLIFCLSQAQANASNCDFVGYCPSKPYDLSSKSCYTVARFTGLNFLAEKIAQAVIKGEIRKATKESFKVELKSYSAKDLLQGKFKSLKISGKNLDVEGVYLSSLESKTLCEFNSVELDKKTIKFRENMVMDYAIEISNKDLKRTVKSVGYLEKLNKINLSGFGITFFKLSSADVEVKNNKLYFTVDVTSPVSSKPLSMSIASDLKVEDGQIVMTKLYFTNVFAIVDLSKMAYVLNALNPLTFSTDVLNNKGTKMKVNSVDIIGDRIFVKGNILIPKNTVKKETFKN
jgi:hypothetical protein